MSSAPPAWQSAAPVRPCARDRIEPIKKTRVAEEIADRIRVLILDGTFPPGRPLPSERVLAERFGVSRGSIRDAFRMLEMIGLLETRHGQGTFPHELDVDRLVTPLASVLTYRRDLQDELMDVRRMFEPAVARVAAARVTDEDLVDLSASSTRSAGSSRPAGRPSARTRRFTPPSRGPRAIASSCSIMETLNDLLVESRKLTLKQKGRPERSIAGHEAVVAALQPARRRCRRATRCASTSIRSPTCCRTPPFLMDEHAARTSVTRRSVSSTR